MFIKDTYMGSTRDPLSLNFYTYCLNNPLIYWDPTGNVAANVQIGNFTFGTGDVTDGTTTVTEQEFLERTGYGKYFTSMGFLNYKLDEDIIVKGKDGERRVQIRKLSQKIGVEDMISYWTDAEGKMNVVLRPEMKDAAVKMSRKEKDVSIDAYFEFTGDLVTNKNKSEVIKGFNAWEKKDYNFFGQNVDVKVNLFEFNGKNYTDEAGKVVETNSLQKRFNIKLTDETKEYDGDSHIEPSNISMFGLHAGAKVLKKYWSISNNSHTIHLQVRNNSNFLSSEVAHEFGHKLGIDDEGNIELAPSYLINGNQYIVLGGSENTDIWYEYRRKEDKNMKELYKKVSRNADIMREGQGCNPNSIISDYDLMRAWSAFEKNKGYIREIGQPMHKEDIL